MKKLNYLLILTGVVVLAGCEQVPQAEIDNANQAIEMLKNSKADVIVPERMAAIEDSLKSALSEVESQKDRMMPAYKKAVAKLTAVSELAAKISEENDQKIQDLIKESESLQVETVGLISKNREIVTKTPRGKEAAAIETMSSEISAADSTLTEAIKLIDSKEYIRGLDLIKSAHSKMTSMNSQLANQGGKPNPKAKQ